MITDPGDIGKIRGGFEKIEDAEEKFCDVVHSNLTSPEDVKELMAAISTIGAGKQRISKLLPPAPEVP